MMELPAPERSPEARLADPARLEPRRVAIAVVVIGAVVATFAAIVWSLSTHVSVEPEFGGAQPRLIVAATRADDGTTVDLFGRSVALRDGRAEVPLHDDALRPGENEVRVTVDGAVHELAFEVPFVVLVDDDAAAANPPRIGVIVRALAGDALRVDGKSVPLDGRAEARVSVPAASDANPSDHEFVLDVVRGGDRIERRVRIVSEPAELDVVQPPREFVSDRLSVGFDAHVAANATVLVDGRLIANEGGRARADLALPQPGDYRFRVDVTEPGRRRRIETFLIRRVADLRATADGFVSDPSVAFADLVVDASRGKRVSFVGRVVHLHVDAGRTFVNLAVAPCARPDGCPLRVEYPATTMFHVDDRIRVSGIVATPAESAAGPVARIEAAFALPEDR